MAMLALHKVSRGGAVANPNRMKNAETVLYRVVNGSPDENVLKIFELMGGIEKIIGANDVVVIKPNFQWWNQGAPNLMSLKTFVDLAMNRPGGFNGEVVIAENNHRGASPWDSAGWAQHFERNSDIDNINNMNELSALLKKMYGDRFSVCHWIDVDAGNKRVFRPEDGTGYVYCDGTGGVDCLQ